MRRYKYIHMGELYTSTLTCPIRGLSVKDPPLSDHDPVELSFGRDAFWTNPRLCVMLRACVKIPILYRQTKVDIVAAHIYVPHVYIYSSYIHDENREST